LAVYIAIKSRCIALLLHLRIDIDGAEGVGKMITFPAVFARSNMNS